MRESPIADSQPAEKLRQAYRYSALTSIIHEQQLREVVKLLRSAGIEPILVKGWAAARLYPEQGLRPPGDIDLCVHPQQFPLAQSVLNSPEGRRYFVDLHKGFETLDNLSFEALFERSQLAPSGDVMVRALGHEDHLRVLCLHFLRHEVSLPLWLCDIAVAVESRPSNFDWDLCLGKDARRADWVACTIGLAHRLLGAYIEDTPAAERAMHLPRWLLPSVLSSWNALCARRDLRYLNEPSMLTYVRKRDLIGAVKAIGMRWPGPIHATYLMEGAFDNAPRLLYQLAECRLRFFDFVDKVPQALRRDQV